MTSPTILVNGPVPAWLLDQLEKHFLHVYRLWQQPDRYEFLRECGEQIHGLVTTGGLGADRGLLESLPNLKVISSMGVGYDAVDVAYARQSGIIVANTPDVLNDTVADLAIALILDVMRGLTASDRYIRTGDWQAGKTLALGHDPKNKVCGIVGLGRIGKAIANRAKAFNMDIAYYGRHEQPEVDYPYYNDLISLANAVDCLVIVVPGGEKTKHMINTDVLNALGANGYLINIARGSVVDEQALVQALQHRVIAGAGLDVFEHEPNVPKELLGLDNVVLTSHIGSATQETRHAMAELTFENIAGFFNGVGVKTPVNE